MVRAAAPGIGLGGIIMIVGILYYTDAGSIVLRHMQSFDTQCLQLVPNGARSVGEPICTGIGYAVEGLTTISEKLRQGIEGIEHRIQQRFGASFEGLGALGSSFEQAVSGLASPADRLAQMASQGPGELQIARDANQQLQQAVDSFSIGQRYLAQGSGTGALSWLTRGAQQPAGYGLLSQLSLGDLYRTGGNGIAADPLRAQAYYQQAANSLVLLNQSNAPQAQQLLQTLPVSPQEMQQQLLQAIAQIKSQAAH